MCRRILIAAVVAAASGRADAGQATCSNPGLPIGAVAAGELVPGRLTLNLASSLLPIHSEEVVDDPLGPVLDETHLRLLEMRLGGEYAVNRWLAVGFGFPYRIVDVDVAYKNPTTGEPVPNASMIHARTETLRGVGDPTLNVRFARDAGAFRLNARAGTSLPLAGTVEDPHLLGSIGQEHQHIQLGTGTLIPFLTVEAQRRFARVTAAAWALARVSLYDNDKGFRAGDRYAAGLNASTALGTRSWTFNAAVEGYAETAETWQGVVYESEGNAGRFDLMVGGGASWRPSKDLAVFADLRVPVYSAVAGSQLDYGPVIGFGVVGTFDTARRASYGRTVDHAVVAPAGSGADLVPVPGRITVFDLWAEWCPPCRELDERLAALARAHPDRLAIRKLDVVDTDSAAWQRHLAPGKFDLPHVKVYGADGRLLFERSAAPPDLAKAIEELLARP
ncbi:MAG: thioredoxin family protein [Deltaproteobacteria bacterium]|nr:thioredoxin family protein [Deltaproteobacteria bacterium]